MYSWRFNFYILDLLYGCKVLQLCIAQIVRGKQFASCGTYIRENNCYPVKMFFELTNLIFMHLSFAKNLSYGFIAPFLVTWFGMC